MSLFDIFSKYIQSINLVKQGIRIEKKQMRAPATSRQWIPRFSASIISAMIQVSG
jgi:hypothetical protein